MIETLNGRIRTMVHRHGHFPNEAAAKKVIYNGRKRNVQLTAGCGWLPAE